MPGPRMMLYSPPPSQTGTAQSRGCVRRRIEPEHHLTEETASRRVVAEQVRIVDVMPTLLDLLGVPAPPCRARACCRWPRREPGPARRFRELVSRATTTAGASCTAVRDGRYKLIRAPRRELYDLAPDPGELPRPRSVRTRARRTRCERRSGRLLAARPPARARSKARADRPRGRGAAAGPRLRGGGRSADATWRSGRAATRRTRSTSTTC